MWVRSQNKHLLVEVKENIAIKHAYKIDANDFFDIWINYFIVGTYITEEKALKVLEKIQEAIDNVVYGLIAVYEMPEE